MRVYISPSDYALDNLPIREHPWTHSEDAVEETYVDFKEHPELVEDVLRSFKPWDAYEGIQRFYDMIRWLNSLESRLETNDCRFDGVEKNVQEDTFPKKLVGRGSVMLFYRGLQHNISPLSREWVEKGCYFDSSQTLPPGDGAIRLRDTCKHYLSQTNPQFQWGAVEISLFTTHYGTLPLPSEDQFGHEVLFKFWVWGNDEVETMTNLKELVFTVWESLKLVSQQIADQRG